MNKSGALFSILHPWLQTRVLEETESGTKKEALLWNVADRKPHILRNPFFACAAIWVLRQLTPKSSNL